MRRSQSFLHHSAAYQGLQLFVDLAASRFALRMRRLLVKVPNGTGLHGFWKEGSQVQNDLNGRLEEIKRKPLLFLVVAPF